MLFKGGWQGVGKERIGIMGGTFNPIHQGHLAMAKAAMKAAGLDRVLMVPSGNPPHKHDIAPAEDRWKMVCAACAQEPELVPDRVELDRPGVIYSIDTLSILKRNYPKAGLYYIIGADTMMDLCHWRDYERVLAMCTFIVCPRTWQYTPEELALERKRLTELGGTLIMMDAESVDVSSTELRTALSRGEPTPLLPVPVREYCGAKGLYGMPRRIMQADAWLDKLFDALTVKRFAHTLAVAHTARHLARVHQVDTRRAEEAGLLHDCAKCMPLKEMQALTRHHALTGDASLLESGALLHSVAGAYLAATEYGVQDPDILRAIACHTTGKPGMTALDMTVYLADKIEPTRENYPQLAQVRQLAQVSLEKAMLASMEGTSKYVKKGGKALHPATLETIAWLHTLPALEAERAVSGR